MIAVTLPDPGNPWSERLQPVQAAQATTGRAQEELAFLGLAAVSAYAAIWLSCLQRFIEAAQRGEAVECWHEIAGDVRARLLHDARLALAILFETADRLSMITLHLWGAGTRTRAA
ncbi:hypothetical protein EV699_102132 [Plasticicumulans lactativorans]|uniref:Uncharacterized protein n=1 Tax=Plasticicumulans lactativorans TaxID=1133106 RepID=A0A4R2LFG8_9GAMM|nr:hypothetical protein [Plasticicumulans lactativorans]TCO83434.1 hypothetical protein EV699_102132 [Plasticicumulans lactativorans]